MTMAPLLAFARTTSSRLRSQRHRHIHTYFLTLRYHVPHASRLAITSHRNLRSTISRRARNRPNKPVPVHLIPTYTPFQIPAQYHITPFSPPFIRFPFLPLSFHSRIHTPTKQQQRQLEPDGGVTRPFFVLFHGVNQGGDDRHDLSEQESDQESDLQDIDFSWTRSLDRLAMLGRPLSPESRERSREQKAERRVSAWAWAVGVSLPFHGRVRSELRVGATHVEVGAPYT